jgi:hypothetical protein
VLGGYSEQRALTGTRQISDATGNEYGKPKDISGEQRTVFTSHADAPFDVCFENILTGCACLRCPRFTC